MSKKLCILQCPKCKIILCDPVSEKDAIGWIFEASEQARVVRKMDALLCEECKEPVGKIKNGVSHLVSVISFDISKKEKLPDESLSERVARLEEEIIDMKEVIMSVVTLEERERKTKKQMVSASQQSSSKSSV